MCESPIIAVTDLIGVSVILSAVHSPIFLEAMRDAGIAYAVDQIVDLIANGVEGIHLYTMNNPYVATKIAENIKSLL